MKNPKGALTKAGQEVKQRAFRDVLNRFNSVFSRFNRKLISVIPSQYRWLVPFLQQELELKPPTVDDLKQRFITTPEGEVIAVEISDELEVVSEEKPLVLLEGDLPDILQFGREIQGLRRRYQVEQYLGDRHRGRIYLGIDISDRRPVVIKEYPLDLYLFNDQEVKERRKRFKSFAGLALADGKIQDFRLIQPLEAIADTLERRCYLIYDHFPDQSQTLAKFLQQFERMNEREVYTVLDQVLQSLQFLHSQKFRFPSGIITVGLSHGNLQLTNLIWVKKSYNFLVYLMDLCLWDELFNGSQKLTYLFDKQTSQTKDLRDLGYIAFNLLIGNIDETSLDPSNENNWPVGINQELKEVIQNLMGLGFKSYSSAEIARLDLIKIDFNDLKNSLDETVEETIIEPKKKRNYRLLFLLLGLLGVFLLGLLIWLFSRNNESPEILTDQSVISLEQIAGIPSGNFTYLTANNGVWRYVLTQPNLLGQGKTLETELATFLPQLYLKYRFPLVSVIEALSFGEFEEETPADFGITSLIDDSPIKFNYEKFAYEKFAYDGLVFFVAFSYANRENSLPNALNGTISLENIRKLYTGKIKNWQEIGGPNLPVRKLYISPDEEMLTIFKQRVLGDEISVTLFNNLLEKKDLKPDSPEIVRLNSSTVTLRSIIGDFEQSTPIASMGFDALSKVFGQCSVYPLAISHNGNGEVSPLLDQNSQQPITPKTDLCQKGSYRHNTEAFITQSYPLTYSLAVVYPRDNRQQPIGRKFAEILKSAEIQPLLRETNLVPLQPLE
jgi:serine/threonine protein kinase